MLPVLKEKAGEEFNYQPNRGTSHLPRNTPGGEITIVFISSPSSSSEDRNMSLEKPIFHFTKGQKLPLLGITQRTAEN